MFSRLLSLVLGLFYIASGFGKLLNVSAFAVILWQYGLPGEAIQYIAVTIPPLEILLGVSLLLIGRPRELAVASAALLVLFTSGFVYAHYAKGVDTCGCFGSIAPLESSPVISIVRNCVLMGLSILLWRLSPKGEQRAPSRWQIVLLCVVGAASFGLSGMSSNDPLYSVEPMLNKRVSETPFSTLVRTSPDSSYLFFVMSVTCPHCWSATENIKAYKRLGRVDEIFAFSAGSDSNAAVYRERFDPNFTIHMVDEKKIAELAGLGVPKVFFVRDDSILYIAPTEIPSPWSLEFETRIRK